MLIIVSVFIRLAIDVGFGANLLGRPKDLEEHANPCGIIIIIII